MVHVAMNRPIPSWVVSTLKQSLGHRRRAQLEEREVSASAGPAEPMAVHTAEDIHTEEEVQLGSGKTTER